MAYDEKNNCDNVKNCETHKWPRNNVGMGGYMRSTGSVKYAYCNNCLAMKIIFSADVLVNGKWICVTDEKVVEPSFG